MAIKAGSLGRGVETFLLTDCGRWLGLRRAGGRDKLSSIHPRASEAVSRAKRTIARTIDERTEGEGVTHPPGEWQRVLSDRMEQNHRNSHMGTGRQF